MATHNLEIFPGVHIKTTVVLNPNELRSSLRSLLSSIRGGLVGLEIEQANGEVDLLKLATSTTCLLIRLRQFPCRALPDVSFVGVGIKYSVDALARAYDIRCRNTIDLASVAAIVKEDKNLQGRGLYYLAYVVDPDMKDRQAKTSDTIWLIFE